MALGVTNQPSSQALDIDQHCCRSRFRLILADEVSFLGELQDYTPSNYLHYEIEHLKEQDFLTFRNETVKLLSKIQYKAEEPKRQVIKTQQVTTFQLTQAAQATEEPEYILDTQQVSAPLVPATQIAAPQPATVIAKSTATTEAASA